MHQKSCLLDALAHECQLKSTLRVSATISNVIIVKLSGLKIAYDKRTIAVEKLIKKNQFLIVEFLNGFR
jgi:dethiobiotin synthetase